MRALKLAGFLLAEYVSSQAAGVRIAWHGRRVKRAQRAVRHHQAALYAEARLSSEAAARLERRMAQAGIPL